MPKLNFAEKLINSPVAAKAGVPQGYPLRRFTPGEPALGAPVVIDSAGAGRIAHFLSTALAVDYQLLSVEAETERGALVFDATGIEEPEQLRELYDFFHPQLRNLAPNARLLVIGTTPEKTATIDARIAARALEGFTRSLAKEMRKGGTVNLIWVEPGATAEIESTVRFFLSGKSAFVDGQVVRVKAATAEADADWQAPSQDRLAVVTGAARGIGATIAEVLARDGAQVICLSLIHI